MTFGILKETGKVDAAKTRKAEKQLQKSCDKIIKTIFEEVTKFQKLAEGEKTSMHFWGSAAHRAFLYLTQKQEDVYISAEIADLFGSSELSDPDSFVTTVDMERLEKARLKEKEKLAKKRAGKSK